MADYQLTHSGAQLDEAISKFLNPVEQATPEITIDASGLITAKSTQVKGYCEGGTKSATANVPTETKSITENGTYTPTSGKFFSEVTVNVPSTGIDTSDATATASDMADGTTAYVNGEKITGTAKNVKSGSSTGWSSAPAPTVNSSTGNIGFSVKVNEPNNSGVLWQNGSYVFIRTPPSNFGDATAEDVAEGKTFTSAAGLKVTGTAESGGVSGGLTVGSADLHNGDEDTADIYLNKGVETAYSGWVTTGYIPIKADTVYAVISTYDAIKGVYCALYDSEKKYVDKISGGFFSANGSPVLFPGSGGYIRFSAAVNTINALSVYECTGSLEFAAGQSTAAALSDDPPAEAELGALTGGEQDA